MYFILENPFMIFVLGGVYGYLVAHNLNILMVTICTLFILILFSMSKNN